MKFSAKYREFILHDSTVDVLEGTTYSGKTTVGAGVKFMLKVAESPKKQHALCGKDKGVIEKNIINTTNGILAEWGGYVQYFGNGTAKEGIAHLVLTTESGERKTIYILGYDDTSRWQKVLGGQLGCIFIDEANIADIAFIEEAMIRCDYACLTLNPDDPDLDVYKKFINHARPLLKYVRDYPGELLGQLNQSPRAGYVHWYFTFDDNIGCTPEKKAQIIANSAEGSKLYKNKILGLRGVGEGSLYGGLLERTEVVPLDRLDTNAFEELVVTVDRGKSTNGEDLDKSHTIIALGGYSKGYKRLVPIASKRISNIEDLKAIEEAEDWLYPYWLMFYGRPGIDTILVDDALGGFIATWQNHSRFGGKISVIYCKKTHPKLCKDLVQRASRKCQLFMKSKQYPTSRVVWCDEEMLRAHRNIYEDKDGSELDKANIWNDYGDCLSYMIIWRIAQLFTAEREEENALARIINR